MAQKSKLVQTDKFVTHAHCPNCKDKVEVGSRYAHGDQMQCGNCSAGLKVVRQGNSLRLLIADLTPLREELKALNKRIFDVDAELARAKASFGIGVNGFGVGVLYVLVKVALEEQVIDRTMIAIAVLISLVVGVLLEGANYLFLTKHRQMSELADEIASLRVEAKGLQQKIKESSR
ncbi:MAG: hypothetical protein NDJ94_14795 [Vicinamibacteria bacterium]|nr:hypothetical protein [Vicinamibacteria bacterium]